MQKGLLLPQAIVSRSGPSGLRNRATLRRLAADDPAHRGIMTQPVGIVHVLVAGEAAEY